MIAAIAALTTRECFRRSFPYVAAAAVVLLALCSHLFQAFSFGSGETEAANLAISAVFLVGLVHATFLATTSVRADLERGTLGLMLSQPVARGSYLAGRFLGLSLSAALLSLAVALAMVGVFALPFSRVGADLVAGEIMAGYMRALPPILMLEAAALAASALLSRVMAPLAILALFLAGSVGGGPILSLVVPDFGLFVLEAGARVRPFAAVGYGLAHALIYLGLAYLALTVRAPLKSQT